MSDLHDLKLIQTHFEKTGRMPLYDQEYVMNALAILLREREHPWRTDEPPKDGTEFVGVYCHDETYLFGKDSYLPELDQYIYEVYWNEEENHPDVRTCEPDEITAWMPIPEREEDNEN